MANALTLNFFLNGASRTVTVADSAQPLLYVLRNSLGQLGPKFACGVSQCGACTVHLNGNEVRSCVLPMGGVPQGAQVATLDGLAPAGSAKLHPMQQAFIDEQAAQCGYCMNGIVMGAIAWMNRRIAANNRAVPSDAEVQAFLSGNDPSSANVYICRCGAHLRVVRAIQRAATGMTQ